MSYSSRLMLATAVLSSSLIGYQVVMLQVISISQWYHFASMVVSIALLGFGAAGTTLSLWREPLVKNFHWLIPSLAIMSGLTMIGAVELSQHSIAKFDSYLLFVNSSQWFSLFINYLLYLLPFYSGALALGIIFVKYANEIGRYYFLNLIGSGVGGLVSALLAWDFLPSVLPALLALTSLLAGMVIFPRERRALVISIALVAFLFESYRVVVPTKLSSSEYKSISRTMNLPEAKIIAEKPSPYGLIQVISAEGLRYAPGMSLAFNGEIPVKNVVFNNGEWIGPIVTGGTYDTVHLLDYTTAALPYALKEKEKVLILHAGTGLNVAQALSRKAKQVHAVEPNEALANLLHEELAVDNDSIFFQPGVKLFAMEPRAFISGAEGKYDVVHLPIVGAFGGTMGMYSMREEFTLTTESFLQLFDLLDDDGVISATVWMDYPFRNSLKLTATLCSILERKGMDKNTHLMAVRSWGTVTFILSKSPFRSEDVIRLRSFCDSLFFDPLLAPGISEQERVAYNGMQDSSFFHYIDKIVEGNREEVFASYDFYLRPATDDRPYFSQFLRWKSIPRLKEVFGTQSVPFLEMGFLVSVITFFQISILAVILIVVPLIRTKWGGANTLWTLLYFGGLGIGYMLLEMVLIQKFILLFANAIYAVAFVISVMLVSSGFGSYLSDILTGKPRAWLIVLMIISLILFVYSLYLSEVLQFVATFSVPLKLIVSFITIAVPSFLMGMPFPTGIRYSSSTDERTVPWAWGVNGCASVISASLASILAVEFGFILVIMIAAITYLISSVSCFFMLRMK